MQEGSGQMTEIQEGEGRLVELRWCTDEIGRQGRGQQLSRDLSPLTGKVGYASVYFRRPSPPSASFPRTDLTTRGAKGRDGGKGGSK